jgi:hypothetical protein
MVQSCFFINFENFYFFYFKLIFFIFLYRFNMLMLKINLKKTKKYYFDIFKKNTLKHNRYHNIKHYLNYNLV